MQRKKVSSKYQICLYKMLRKKMFHFLRLHGSSLFQETNRTNFHQVYREIKFKEGIKMNCQPQKWQSKTLRTSSLNIVAL